MLITQHNLQFMESQSPGIHVIKQNRTSEKEIFESSSQYPAFKYLILKTLFRNLSTFLKVHYKNAVSRNLEFEKKTPQLFWSLMRTPPVFSTKCTSPGRDGLAGELCHCSSAGSAISYRRLRCPRSCCFSFQFQCTDCPLFVFTASSPFQSGRTLGNNKPHRVLAFRKTRQEI